MGIKGVMTTTTVHRIHVALERNSYDVVIGDGSLGAIGAELLNAGVKPGRRVLVVSNPDVAGPYGETVMNSLQRQGFSAEMLVIEAGEQQKTPATLGRIHDAAFNARLERSSLMLAAPPRSDTETWSIEPDVPSDPPGVDGHWQARRIAAVHSRQGLWN